MEKQMKNITKFTSNKNGITTKALRFLKGEKVKYIVSLTTATNGLKWKDDNRNERTIAFLKKVDSMFTARALVVGKYKLSFIACN